MDEWKSQLTSDLKMRPEFIGLQGLLNPYVQYCSAQRAMMFASNLSQALVIDGCEPPFITTGYEPIVGKYEFDGSARDQDAMILAIIPKFKMTQWNCDSTTIPTHTVIYVGQDDNKIHCVDVCNYNMLHNGFGYMITPLNMHNLTVNNYIPKDMKFMTSPNHDGEYYSMGLNANVVYLSEWGVTEDAFIISESLAKKGENTAICQLKLNIGEDDVPLNLYGDDSFYKAFPDIGETVRDDGVLVALRGRNKTTFVSDMTNEALQNIEYLHDKEHKAVPGATVLDVDVYVNFDALRNLRGKESVYSQFMKYREQHGYYWQAVIDVWEKVKEEGYELGSEFNTLVTRCIGMLAPRKYVGRRLQLIDKREPVEFISVVITYGYKRGITLGSKLTDRSGGKGVLSAIWPDKNMPVDDFGNRADIIITPASVINRMNPSQLYEQFFNRCSVEVIKTMKQMNDWRKEYEYVMQYLADYRMAYAMKVKSLMKSDSDKMSFVEACKNEGIFLVGGFTTNFTEEYIISMAEKYGVKTSPINYIAVDKAGNEQHVRTISKTIIGSKYMMLLGKIPSSMIHSVELAYVSQFETPIKPTNKYVKSQSSIGQTPQRFGEDEICMLNMSLFGDVVARLMCTSSAAAELIKQEAHELLTCDKPSQISFFPFTTQEAINRNKNISIFSHLMGEIGYDVRPNMEGVDVC